MERSRSAEKVIYIVFCLFFQTLDCLAATHHAKSAEQVVSAVERAKPFDTVIVAGGIYKINDLRITKPLILSGSNKPVFDGMRKNQLISVFSSDVIVEGIVFRNGGKSDLADLAGIKISQARNVVIRNNEFENMFFAVYFQESSNCLVTNNIVRSNAVNELQSGNGIHCWKCDSMTVSNNTLSGNRDGIYFEFVTHSSITNNHSLNNIRYGLHFMFSHNNSYIDNKFESNGAGVAVMYTHHVIMRNNIFSNNWGSAAYGILLKEISDSEITGNQFTENTAAIYMEGTNRVVVSRNIFKANGCALRVQASCDGNTITENNFHTNTFDVTTNGSLVLNSFNGNYWDKYEGYDLNRDGKGDVPYRPVSLYSMIIERMPVSLIFMRSFLVNIMDKTEKAVPSITPENFKDDIPSMKAFAI